MNDNNDIDRKTFELHMIQVGKVRNIKTSGPSLVYLLIMDVEAG